MKTEKDMKQFDVEIAESLIRRIPVFAASEVEAIGIIAERYKNAEVVLTSDDYVEVNFSAHQL